MSVLKLDMPHNQHHSILRIFTVFNAVLDSLHRYHLVQVFWWWQKLLVQLSQVIKSLSPRILQIDRIISNSISILSERDKLHSYFDSLQFFLNNFTYLFGNDDDVWCRVSSTLAVSFFMTITLMNYWMIYKIDRFVNFADLNGKYVFIDIINS